MTRFRLLFLDDEANLPHLEWEKILVGPMASLGFEIVLESNPENLESHLRTGCSGVLLDLKFGKDLRLGFELLRDAKKAYPHVPVLILTVDSGIDVELECLGEGADGYVCKSNIDIDLLADTFHLLINGVAGSHLLLGYSDEARKLRMLIREARHCDSTVLITGPTGTGKELVARGIHLLGSRSNSDAPFGNFVPVNCAGVPDTLWESEMFGHRRGAATGLANSHAGAFLTAGGYRVEREPRLDSDPIPLMQAGWPGTLFLDEVGEMSMTMQAKLLRAVQERRVRLVGDPREYPVGHRLDVRLIAATNRDLHEAVYDREFRMDLYYRLQVLPIDIPPLSARLEDIPVLVAAFIKEHCPSDGPLIAKQVSDGALALLNKHPWPGNIRELGNVIERSLVRLRLDGDSRLEAHHIMLDAGLMSRADDLCSRVAQAILEGRIDPQSINPRPQRDAQELTFGIRVYRSVADVLRKRNELSQEKLAEVWGLDKSSIGPLNTQCGVRIRGGKGQ